MEISYTFNIRDKQNPFGWKRPFEIIWCSPPGLPRTMCSQHFSIPTDEWSLPNLSGKRHLVSDRSHKLLKMCFLVFRWSLTVFNCQWMPLGWAWLPPFHSLWSGITHIQPSPGWTVSAIPACPYVGDAPVLQSSLWPCAGLASVSPCLFCAGEPSRGCSASGVAPLGLTRGEGSPPSTF